MNSYLPTELRLLLSAPDNDCVSAIEYPFILEVGVAILAGRESLRSLSISERRGLLGVS